MRPVDFNGVIGLHHLNFDLTASGSDMHLESTTGRLATQRRFKGWQDAGYPVQVNERLTIPGAIQQLTAVIGTIEIDTHHAIIGYLHSGLPRMSVGLSCPSSHRYPLRHETEVFSLDQTIRGNGVEPGRYTHRTGYVTTLPAKTGFTLRSLQSIVIRRELDADVAGIAVVARCYKSAGIAGTWIPPTMLRPSWQARYSLKLMVEPGRIELPASALRTRRSPS